MSIALLAPLPLGTVDVLPPARADPGLLPVFWAVDDLTVRWGPNAVDSGLVSFLELNTPAKARYIHRQVQGVIDATDNETLLASLMEAQNLTMTEMETLVSRLTRTTNKHFLVKDLYLASTGKTWGVNSQRSHTIHTLPPDPMNAAMHALYETLDIDLSLEQEIKLASAVSSLSVDVQPLIANLIFAVSDAHREVGKMTEGTAAPPGVLSNDVFTVLSALRHLQVNTTTSGEFVLDYPADIVPQVTSSVGNLSALDTSRHAKAAIFMLQAIQEVAQGLREASPLMLPMNSHSCDMTFSRTPTFADPLCLVVVFSTSGPTELTCGIHENELDYPLVVVGGVYDDIYNCPVGATTGGASLLLDVGGDNRYRWDGIHWSSGQVHEGRSLWAFGAAYLGAAVFYDMGTCSSIGGRSLRGGLGAGHLGTGYLATGDPAYYRCNGLLNPGTELAGTGSVQGVGVFGLGIADYLGASKLNIWRMGEHSLCIMTDCLDMLREGVVFTRYDYMQSVEPGFQGTGAGYLGGGLVLAAQANVRTHIRNNITWDRESCREYFPSDFGSGAIDRRTVSATSGIGVGFAGLGMVIHPVATVNQESYILSESCRVRAFGPGNAGQPVLTQGWGGYWGIGAVATNNGALNEELGGLQRKMGSRGLGGYAPEHFVGGGIGFMGGTGAVLDVASNGVYQFCRPDLSNEEAPRGQFDVMAPCGATRGYTSAGGIGAAFGIGLFKSGVIPYGSNDDEYECDRMRCFGGSYQHHFEDKFFDPTAHNLLYEGGRLVGFGFFMDAAGNDTYQRGGLGIGNDVYGLVREDGDLPMFRGLFMDCAATSICEAKEGGFVQWDSE